MAWQRNLAKTTAISRNLQQSTRNKMKKVNTEQQTNYKLKLKTIKLVLREYECRVWVCE